MTQLQSKTYRVDANGYIEIQSPGDGVAIVSAPGRVRVLTSNGDDVIFGQGQGANFSAEYTRLEIRNESGTDQDVELAFGFGDFRDALVAGEVALLLATGFSIARVAVGLAAVQVAAANTGRKKGVTVKALSTNSGTVYVGVDATVTTADGFELTPGSAITFENTGEVYAIADAAAQAVSVVEE